MRTPDMTPVMTDIGPLEPMQDELPMEEASAGLGARLGNLVSRAGEIASSVGDFARDTASNIGDAIHTGYDYVSERYDSLKFGAKTVAAIGGIAFVGAQAAELATNAEPAKAGTGNTPEAVASGGLIKRCIKRGLAKPNVTLAALRHPGDKHNQEFRSHLIYEGMPGCEDSVHRSYRVRLQIQDYRDHHRWIDMVRGRWLDLYSNDQSVINAIALKPDGRYGKKIYYHPTPGPGETHAREIIKNVVRDNDGNKLGQKIYKTPVDVIAPRSKR